MRRVDVIVVGAGLAGLQCSRLLAGHGLEVLLVDRKPSLDQSVHTTGIFVRRSLDDFALPPACLGPPIRRVTLYSPARRPLSLESPHEEFRIGHMAELYTRLLKDCQAAGVEWSPSTGYFGCQRVEGGLVVRLDVAGAEQTVGCRFLIAADGATSRVARDLQLSVNRHWIVGLEEVFHGAPLSGEPQLHCFLDAKLAPGYVAWVAQDGQTAHVGVGGYRDRFQPSAALDKFRASLGSVIDLAPATLIERRGGRIPVGGVLPQLANRQGLLIGDAAGAVSPLTAGGLDPCLRLSELAAKVVHRYLATGDASQLDEYDGRKFRGQFLARRVLRGVYALAGRNALLEACCAALRLPGVRGLAQHIFFSRGSFPDVREPQRGNRPLPSLAQAQDPQAVAVD